MKNETTVGNYLINALAERDVDHMFGVPGDYALGFFHDIEQCPLEMINTSDEQGAGFAADAYARINGLGVLCVTYCVGGLKVANTTAQAYAEKSPVVVISGAPGTDERSEHPLLHHKVHSFDSQLKIFNEITVDSTIIDDASTACSEIDRVLDSAMRFKRPVYIELPRNMVSETVVPAAQRFDSGTQKKESKPEVMDEFLTEAADIITQAEQPVILAGVEVHRFDLQDQLYNLLESTRIPVASTILSKSIVNETHPRYLGVYEGAMGKEKVREYVEQSDCIIMLGVFMSDLNLGIYTAHIDQGKAISVSSETTSVHYHQYEGLNLHDVIPALSQADLSIQPPKELSPPPKPQKPELHAEEDVTVEYLFKRLNVYLDDNTVVLADPGDALFGAADMTIHRETEFLSPAYYASLGFAVPGSIGAQLADPDLRPLVLVGDGSFQMTGMELSSVVRFGLNPIVIVLNNGGYGTERPMLDGKFNDVLNWKYDAIPEVLQGGEGFDVHTEGQLEEALTRAKENDCFSLLDVHLDPSDSSPSLQRLTASLKDKV